MVTRENLCEWLRKNLGISYTTWKRFPRERRLKDYAKYQRGGSVTPSTKPIEETPCPAVPTT